MMENYKYKIDRQKTQCSKPEIIQSLKKFHEICGKDTFGLREYDKWPYRIASSGTIRTRFGTWGKALLAAGIRAERSCKLELKEMVKHFKLCWQENDAVPSYRQLETYLSKNKLPFRVNSYQNMYGGLGYLAKLIVQVQEGQLPEEKLYRRKNKNSREPISPTTRMKVLKRDNFRCVKCGANPKEDKNVKLEIDHIIPVAKGGLSKIDNLQTLCYKCNQGKKDSND